MGDGPADDRWLPVLARRLGRPVAVTGRCALSGGYHGGVERVDLDGAPPVVVKRTTAAEVAALRALAVVRGVERPALLAAGADWVVTWHYGGPALAEGPDVPVEVWTALARVHAHWLGRRPRGLPVTDGAWWRGLCLDRIRPHLQAGADRATDPVFATGAAALTGWAEDRRMHAALALLPRTLTHGDAHRGNVLCTPAGPALIDWGNARVAPPGFDLAVLRAQGATDLQPYRAVFAELAGAPPAELLAVEEACADVYTRVGYLGFAADHLGAARVGEMIDGAARALDTLTTALRSFALRTDTHRG
ncbi:MAG: phosphotransferase [Pseudonocardia sp.]